LSTTWNSRRENGSHNRREKNANWASTPVLRNQVTNTIAMQPESKIYVAGHRGLVGSAIVRALRRSGFNNLVVRTHEELELEDQASVHSFFEQEKPEYVFLAAAKVGGILANSTYPADFIRSNLIIQLNIVESAFRSKATKLLFLGSSCIYPKFAPQPIQEGALLTGELEPTNEPYAIAKIAGIKLCESYNRQHGTNFVSVMPTNLYGPGDSYDLQNSHVLPALLRKFHEAKVSGAERVLVWGSGKPRREFLHVDDMAEACVQVMLRHNGSEIVNIGYGEDVSIAELASAISAAVGYPGKIEYDASKPDGTPRKLLDSTRIRAIGWQPRISLPEGIASTYQDFLQVANRASPTAAGR
jgi:GDP-L-fucose synthase